jgi:hypothetical protein
MNRKHAEAIGEFVADMIRTHNNETGYTFEALQDKFAAMFDGVPGTGACICQHNPENFKRMWGDDPKALHEARGCMIFDHRCTTHGEKAQPVLWGRHKDKQLSVTWKEWESLGVTHT